MKRPQRRFSPLTLLALSLLFLGAFDAAAQTATTAGACKLTPPTPPKAETPPPGTLSGVRIVVKGADDKPVARKRFYLVERSVQAAGGVDLAGLPKREDFLKGASPQLRAWFEKHDCDSLYCPELENEFDKARKDVPEMKRAYEEGLRRYGNRNELALRWITVNFPLKEARTGYYMRKRAWLEREAKKFGLVASAMTSEKGEAYFPDVKLATYYVTNLAPLGDGNVVWDCAVTVPPPVPKQIHSVTVDMTVPKAAAPK